MIMMAEIDFSTAITITIETIGATITTTDGVGSTATAIVKSAKGSSSELTGTLGNIDRFVLTPDCRPHGLQFWLLSAAVELPHVRTTNPIANTPNVGVNGKVCLSDNRNL